jgi:hypothetical protein
MGRDLVGGELIDSARGEQDGHGGGEGVQARQALPGGSLSRLAEASARMAPSTLFMSWATPPARMPRLSIFWD